LVDDPPKIAGRYTKGIKNTKVLGFADKFYNHGSREEVLEMAGLSPSHIKKAVKECCN